MVWPLKDRVTFQRSPFKFRAAGKSPSIFFRFIPSIHSEGRRKEGRFPHLVTCAYLTFADGLNFSTSYYKSPLDREEGPSALTKHLRLKISIILIYRYGFHLSLTMISDPILVILTGKFNQNMPLEDIYFKLMSVFVRYSQLFSNSFWEGTSKDSTVSTIWQLFCEAVYLLLAEMLNRCQCILVHVVQTENATW